MRLPDDMDPECIPICTAMNNLPGIRTVESCCGHGERPHWIFFLAETIDSLCPILRAAESSDWKVEVYWSNGGGFAMFWLQGPIGAADMPGGANDFTSWLEGNGRS